MVNILNWLTHTTRPDLTTVVSLLAHHQSNTSLGHNKMARYATKYVADTKILGIYQLQTIYVGILFTLSSPKSSYVHD